MIPTSDRSYRPHRSGGVLALLALVVGTVPAHAATPTPLATPAAATATGAATAAPPAATASAAATALAATASPIPTGTAHPSPRATPVAAPADELDTAPPDAGAVPAASATRVAARPRTFRTPERAVPPVFVAPQGAPPAAAPGAPLGEAPSGSMRPSRSTAAVVVFRATARTAVEGFDLRVAYPPALGSFAGAGLPADCNAGTGTLVAANDRGDGELRVLVASAQALSFPLDVFCRFTVAAGGGVDRSAFQLRVAEVTSDGKQADPSLLIVEVVVR